ncbi:MAG: purine-nucleoside phosphorylase [Nannocystaceae bacterium]
MSPPAKRDHDTTAQLKQRLGSRGIDWAIVCGSGLGSAIVGSSNPLRLTDRLDIPLTDLGLPAPTVAGHGHTLVWGMVGSQRVCVQTGRLHPYEGQPVQQCVATLDAMLQHGAKQVLLTAAVGALREDLVPGQVVVLRDQINLFGPTPLVGPRFVDCSELYDLSLRTRAIRTSEEQGSTLREVVYAHARGPQYETPAEVAALRALGGDVVGMSTTYEAICAAARGARTCGLALITNTAAAVGLSHDDVQARAHTAHDTLAALIRGILG